ncbi:MAG: recombinase family protein [Pirellulaceae bacterium]
MNVVIWARVSSREQREGYSIDAQLRATREKAQKAEWTCIREFVVAESAKRGAERVAFNEMYRWIRANARREQIGAILSHKLDRVCRNMRDAVRLQELEDTCGVHLAFVDNQFGPGAAGALSLNVVAAVAQYYSDNLRTEVLKGMDEKVRQGWPTGGAPFGYMNVDDRNEPVQPHPEKGPTVVRIFELYATGTFTFESLANRLAAEGHAYSACQPRFQRTALSYILNNRFYIGELRRNGAVFEGKYRRLIDRVTFDTCQDVLQGKNRRITECNLPYAGGLFTCVYCSQAITGERIRRKLRGGGVREHVYYRCANNAPGPDHPIVRWRESDLEIAIVKDLHTLQFPDKETAGWFRQSLVTSFSDLESSRKRQLSTLAKRKSELATMQDRLLNAYLTNTIDEATYNVKSAELKSDALKAEEEIEKLNDVQTLDADLGLKLFDWSQNVAELWRGSNNRQTREILDLLCLNRAMSDVRLLLAKRKPFDFFPERLKCQSSRPNCHSFEPCLADCVDALLRPDAYFRQLQQLTRQCA